MFAIVIAMLASTERHAEVYGGLHRIMTDTMHYIANSKVEKLPGIE